jgi:carbonic anhydrase
LRSSEPVLKKTVEAGTIEVAGAYYDLDTGAVAFTEEKKN